MLSKLKFFSVVCKRAALFVCRMCLTERMALSSNLDKLQLYIVSRQKFPHGRVICLCHYCLKHSLCRWITNKVDGLILIICNLVTWDDMEDGSEKTYQPRNYLKRYSPKPNEMEQIDSYSQFQVVHDWLSWIYYRALWFSRKRD